MHESLEHVRHRDARVAQREGRLPRQIAGDLPGAIEQLCPLDDDAGKLLLGLATRRNLSMRAIHRLRRVARTIADLDPELDPRAPLGVQSIALAARLRRLPDTLAAE